MVSELIHKSAGPFGQLLAVQFGQFVISLANMPVKLFAQALFQLSGPLSLQACCDSWSFASTCWTVCSSCACR